LELVSPGHIPAVLHSQIELARFRATLSRVRESDLEGLPVRVVERPSTTLGHADQIPEGFESLIVNRRLRPNGSHVGIIESWIVVHDHPHDFYREFVKTTILVTKRSDGFAAGSFPFSVLRETS
jgi:hypothetical protein